MPHLKVRPFDTSRLKGRVAFRALPEGEKGPELVGVGEGEELFILEIKKSPESYLIRSDKISRPLDSNRIKKALAELRDKAGLEVLHSNIELSPNRPPVAAEYDKKIEEFYDGEFPFEKVVLEVGFGSGRHLLWQAKEHPDTLFVGIEIHTPSAQQVLRQIHLQQLKNIWVLNYDARLLLEMLPSNRLEAIYVHFPVPWDKKPHRRVISDAFVEEALRVLRPGGFLELRTDSENYYRYALEVFSCPVKAEFLVEKNRDLPVVSKYEARWRRMEKNIYTLTLYAREESSAKEMRFDFGFRGAVTAERVAALPREAQVEEEFFVHFGRRYRFAEGGGGIIECSFGSFDRPEHKYLFWSEGEAAHYFPGLPVRSAANQAAHQRIGEWLHG
ncbi:tRNA (guanosine(46)-N7)-methyltransferase TrmB [Nitratifractor sp.]